MKDEDRQIPLTLAELRAVARKCFCVDCKKLATQEAYDERKTFDLCDEHGEEWAEECEVSEKETSDTIRAVQARIDGLSAKAERWALSRKGLSGNREYWGKNGLWTFDSEDARTWPTVDAASLWGAFNLSHHKVVRL